MFVEGKKKTVLIFTLLLIALIQMPHLALTPGIDLIATKIFPERSIQTIQTVVSLPNILSAIAGLLAAMVIKSGIATKKALVVTGLLILGATGAVAVLLHSQFWQLCLMNVLVGLGMGTFIPSAQSVMFDSFDEKTRQFISGAQFSFVNGGAIILGILGGVLTTVVWYGGYLMMFAAIPVAAIAFITLPGSGKKTAQEKVKKTPLPGAVYYYAVMIFIYMMMFSIATSNLSTHLAESHIGDAASAGVATALMMGGGVIGGFFFSKMSRAFGDFLFVISLVLLCIGYAILGFLTPSITATFAAMFIVGLSMCTFIPRCVFCVSC